MYTVLILHPVHLQTAVMYSCLAGSDDLIDKLVMTSIVLPIFQYSGILK